MNKTFLNGFVHHGYNDEKAFYLEDLVTVFTDVAEPHALGWDYVGYMEFNDGSFDNVYTDCFNHYAIIEYPNYDSWIDAEV
jgi:hypothetical protein